jgi:hypothetical protein
MGTHTVHRAGATTTGAGSDLGRVVFTLIGVAALVVGAFLGWTRGVTGDRLTNHALAQTRFFAERDIVKTVGGIAILLGMAALVGLVDRTGWLTRLAGALGIVVFVLFAIEVYRSAQHQVQAGAWIALVGAIALVLAGFLGSREVVQVPTVVEQQAAPAASDAHAEQS